MRIFSHVHQIMVSARLAHLKFFSEKLIFCGYNHTNLRPRSGQNALVFPWLQKYFFSNSAPHKQTPRYQGQKSLIFRPRTVPGVKNTKNSRNRPKTSQSYMLNIEIFSCTITFRTIFLKFYEA